jgi:hypothetical protein
MTDAFWTEADQAELDVLLHALVFDYWEHKNGCIACDGSPCPQYEAWFEHKASCRACQGDAPLTFPPSADCRRRHSEFVAHGDACWRCNPCPHLKAAIAEVLDWREARILLSRAEALRAERGPVPAETSTT